MPRKKTSQSKTSTPRSKKPVTQVEIEEPIILTPVERLLLFDYDTDSLKPRMYSDWTIKTLRGLRVRIKDYNIRKLMYKELILKIGNLLEQDEEEQQSRLIDRQ